VSLLLLGRSRSLRYEPGQASSPRSAIAGDLEELAIRQAIADARESLTGGSRRIQGTCPRCGNPLRAPSPDHEETA
jgi:hypothetical protein